MGMLTPMSVDIKNLEIKEQERLNLIKKSHKAKAKSKNKVAKRR